MARSIFRMGFGTDAPWNSEPSGIPVLRMTRTAIEADGDGALPRLLPGKTVTLPYMVKVEGEGEYWIRVDGTMMFYSYREGRWQPPQRIKNKSMLENMFPEENGNGA